MTSLIDAPVAQAIDAAAYTKGPDQSVPDWVNKEGGVIFEQMFKQQPRIQGVLAANDGLAGAVIDVLKKKKLNGKVPVTGQDATVEGLQNVLAGTQCMTVYKSATQEAEALAEVAIALANGEEADVTGSTVDSSDDSEVPSILLEPQAITKDNVGDVIDDGGQKAEDVCTGDFAKLCDEAGIG